MIFKAILFNEIFSFFYRIFYTEVIQKHSIMPFNLRNFEDEKKAKMGVMECVNHKLIEPFQVLFEKTGIIYFCDH